MSQPPAAKTPDGSFISFSTNYEDVTLRRLFHNRTEGFFVDVGAQHPILGNDFYGLYAQGWTGINIDPNPAYFDLLQKYRPRDRNLQLALSDIAGQDLAFFEVSDTGLSTCDEAQAEACRARGHVVRRHEVHSSTLRDVFEAAGAPRIDVLKVDVEGLEEQVLLGNNWERYRPSIVMVEVTYPETAIRRPTGITRHLEAIGYRHLYFDNLNDFFADTDFDVSNGMILPPNVFDNFVRYEVVSLREETVSLRTSFLTASEYAHALEADRGSLETQARALQAEHVNLQGSLDSLATRTGALGQENVALGQHNARLGEVAAQAAATVTMTRHVAVAAMLGRHDQLRSLLAFKSVTVPEQKEELPMPEQSRELVTISGEGVIDGHEPQSDPNLSLGETKAELIAAQLQALDEQNCRFHEDIADLRHENRRLLASLRQAQGENLSLQRALGPSYATRDELFQLRETISALQTGLGQHHRAVSSDFEARVCAALDERIALLAVRDEPVNAPTQPDPAENPDTLLLNAMLASTSWRVTRPLRALRSLFGATRK